ncbi:MAG TPA: response regulator [Planctomycetes bacterium]|nr:response regulator [Planctomycetota bacterium]
MANILIVDDSGTMRKIIMRGIRQAGFKVDSFVEAEDGVKGLSALEGTSVDLILSDVNMPNMNGLDFLSAVREKYGTSTPVVMITTEGSNDVVNEARTRGANGYLKKPFTPEQVQTVLGPFIG